jgi:hypothetical protein
MTSTSNMTLWGLAVGIHDLYAIPYHHTVVSHRIEATDKELKGSFGWPTISDTLQKD